MQRYIFILCAVLGIADLGLAQTQTNGRSTAKVPPPRRFNQTVPIYDVRMDLKSPRELEQEALEGNRKGVQQDRDEYFVDEPVNMKPPVMRQRPRQDADKKDDKKDWLDIGDKEDKKTDDRKKDSGWGWLADDSRGEAADRDEREKELAARETDLDRTSRTNSTPAKDSVRTLSRIGDGHARTPGSSLADPVNRQRPPSEDGLRSTERPKVADAPSLPETHTAQRAAWMPGAGTWGAPSPEAGPRPATGIAGAFEPAVSAGSRDALAPGGGWAPLRIEAIPSWTLPASTPSEPAILPRADTPRYGSGYGAAGGYGVDKPAITPSPVPGLDVRTMGQKPLMDGVGVMPALR